MEEENREEKGYKTFTLSCSGQETDKKGRGKARLKSGMDGM